MSFTLMIGDTTFIVSSVRYSYTTISATCVHAKGYEFERMTWIKLLKDYDVTIQYHLHKANIVADTLI